MALIEPIGLPPFAREVPPLVRGRPMEAALTGSDGLPMKSEAVWRLPEADFARIVNLGLSQDPERIEATRYDPQAPDLTDGAKLFERPG